MWLTWGFLWTVMVLLRPIHVRVTGLRPDTEIKTFKDVLSNLWRLPLRADELFYSKKLSEAFSFVRMARQFLVRNPIIFLAIFIFHSCFVSWDKNLKLVKLTLILKERRITNWLDLLFLPILHVKNQLQLCIWHIFSFSKQPSPN